MAPVSVKPSTPALADDDFLFDVPVYDNPRGLLRFKPVSYEAREGKFAVKDEKTGQTVEEVRKFVIVTFEITDVLDKPANRERYVGKKISDSIGISLGPKAAATQYAKAFLGAAYDPSTVREKFRLNRLIAEGREIEALVREEPKGDRKFSKIIRESLQPAE